MFFGAFNGPSVGTVLLCIECIEYCEVLGCVWYWVEHFLPRIIEIGLRTKCYLTLRTNMQTLSMCALDPCRACGALIWASSKLNGVFEFCIHCVEFFGGMNTVLNWRLFILMLVNIGSLELYLDNMHWCPVGSWFHHYALFGIIILLQRCTTYGSNIKQSFTKHGKTPSKGKGKPPEYALYVVAQWNIKDLFNASLVSWKYAWLLDLGATCHMNFRRNLFEELTDSVDGVE